MLFNISRHFNPEDISSINNALDRIVCPFADNQEIFRHVDINRLSDGAGVIVAKGLEINDLNELREINSVLENYSRPIKRKIVKDLIIARRENIIFPSLVKEEIHPDEIVEHHLYMHVGRDQIVNKMLPSKVNNAFESKNLDTIIPEQIIFFNEPTMFIQATTNEVLRNFNLINNLAGKVSRNIGRISLSQLELTAR